MKQNTIGFYYFTYLKQYQSNENKQLPQYKRKATILNSSFHVNNPRESNYASFQKYFITYLFTRCSRLKFFMDKKVSNKVGSLQVVFRKISIALLIITNLWQNLVRYIETFRERQNSDKIQSRQVPTQQLNEYLKIMT